MASLPWQLALLTWHSSCHKTGHRVWLWNLIARFRILAAAPHAHLPHNGPQDSQDSGAQHVAIVLAFSALVLAGMRLQAVISCRRAPLIPKHLFRHAPLGGTRTRCPSHRGDATNP